jgi:hypothetical protein
MLTWKVYIRATFMFNNSSDFESCQLSSRHDWSVKYIYIYSYIFIYIVYIYIYSYIYIFMHA